MTTIIHDAPNHLDRIDACWMVISTDDTGEGLCAAPMSGVTLPLIACDEKRLADIIRIAEHMAKIFPHRKMKLIKLTTREDVREIGGTAVGAAP
jgi:hypothetical protein